MRLTLLLSVKNYLKETHTVMYGQEDGQYYVLRAPINPIKATSHNAIKVFPNLSSKEAENMME